MEHQIWQIWRCIRVRIPQKLDVMDFWSWMSMSCLFCLGILMSWLLVIWKNGLESQCYGLIGSVFRCRGLLKGKHFLRFILYFSYKLFRKFSPHFQNFSLSFLTFPLKFWGDFPPIQNIPVLLKKFYKVSSRLVYILIVTGLTYLHGINQLQSLTKYLLQNGVIQ